MEGMEAIDVVKEGDFWKLQHVILDFVDITRDLEIGCERLHSLGQAVVSLQGTTNLT